MAFVAHLWLRIGNTYSANNIFSFLEDTLHKLQVKKIGLLSGDSGFYSDKIFNHVEERETPISYIIAVPLYAPIQKKYPNSEFDWIWETALRLLRLCILVTTVRRIVMVRQGIQARPKASFKQLRLFRDSDSYNSSRYHIGTASSANLESL